MTSSSPKKKQIKVNEVKIREKVVFHFADERNADRVSLALSRGGYYVRALATSSGYSVYVYTDRNL